jgi:AcrR family transcriptional regulator
VPKAASEKPKARRRSASRDEDILRAAAELFYERSFVAVGVDEIGDRVGVTGSAIYHHFSGKDQILATLFDEAIDGLVEATAGELDDPFEELEALVRGHARFVLGERKLAGVKIREERSLAEPFQKRLRRRERRYVDRWLDCVRRCFPARDPAELAVATHVALGALNSVALWPREVLEAADPPDVVATVVLGGLLALEPSPTDSGAAYRA